MIVPCLPGSTDIPETPTYKVDGPRDGCPAPYVQCTRRKDAETREGYIRALERLREDARPCVNWPGAGGDGALVETVELEDVGEVAP